MVVGVVEHQGRSNWWYCRVRMRKLLVAFEMVGRRQVQHARDRRLMRYRPEDLPETRDDNPENISTRRVWSRDSLVAGINGHFFAPRCLKL